MESTKKHIYFVPGLAASPKIFEFLQISEEKFELHFLDWLIPESLEEPIEDYAQRMAQKVTEPNAILVGVSFGGVMVQEMSKHLDVEKVALISSIKDRDELPQRLKLIQKTKAYKLFPANAVANIEDFYIYALGETAKKRTEIYRKYLSVRNPLYLNWAIYNVLHWKQKNPMENILHIHGTDDHMFPVKHISNCIEIQGGTHVMILNKAKTISKILTESL